MLFFLLPLSQNLYFLEALLLTVILSLQDRYFEGVTRYIFLGNSNLSSILYLLVNNRNPIFLIYNCKKIFFYHYFIC